jgi:hypothetical protein
MKNIHILPINLDSVFQQSNGYIINQNVYITSNEEIKEGGWLLIIDDFETYVHKHKGDNLPTTYHKKIILTTDQDLIKDGVQAIDDEFLEWFVKNPSCEFIEYVGDDCYYEIIIPQEEPKQETLEEAADNWVRKPVIGTKRESFIAGANWQAERMYTYDEMRTIAYNAYCLGQLDSPTEGKFNLWIQKSKKE